MKKVLRLIPLFISLLACFSAFSQTPDSLISASYIQRNTTYQDVFPFVRYEKNYVEWTNSELIKPFFEKIKRSHEQKVRILHIGDSHIQFDLVSGTVRNGFQEIFGAGGRGLIFPYSAARTNSPYDYVNYHTGYWENTKNIHYDHSMPVGVSGATIQTTDARSSFKFIFQRGTIQSDFRKIKIYAQQSPKSFALKLVYSAEKEPINISLNDSTSTLPYTEILLPQASDTLEFLVEKTAENQKFLQINGILVESDRDKGVLYNSVGINGAGYKSILKQSLFNSHLQALAPDLVVVDLGINDFYIGRFNVEDVKRDITRMIDTIRQAVPNAMIMMADVQDTYRGRYNLLECQLFSQILKQIALQKSCAFYNYYEISGGRYSMVKWLNYGLTQYDRLHLTPKGYRVRGELYKNALLNSYQYYLSHTETDSLLIEKFVPEDISLPIIAQNNVQIEQATRKIQIPQQQAKITYTVKRGDHLAGIASKFGVSAQTLKEWNRLKNDRILAGNILVLYTDVNKFPYAQTKKGLQNVQYKNQKITGKHTVKNGDSLWKIAQKYGTTVDKIRNANGLFSDKLQIGQSLKIAK